MFFDARVLCARGQRIAHTARAIARGAELGSTSAAMLERCVLRGVRGVEAIGVAERQRLAVEGCARVRKAPLERVERGRGRDERRSILLPGRLRRYSHAGSPGGSIKLCGARALAATGGRGA